jgi:hypothetical protein
MEGPGLVVVNGVVVRVRVNPNSQHTAQQQHCRNTRHAERTHKRGIFKVAHGTLHGMRKEHTSAVREEA